MRVSPGLVCPRLPTRITYLERAVTAALKRAAAQATDTVTKREAALRDARRELDNIATAIRRSAL